MKQQKVLCIHVINFTSNERIEEENSNGWFIKNFMVYKEQVFVLFEKEVVESKPKRTRAKNASVNDYDFSDLSEPIQPILKEWVEYKIQKGEKYVEKGFNSLKKKIVKEYGGDVERLRGDVMSSMSNNWKGIYKGTNYGGTGRLPKETLNIASEVPTFDKNNKGW